uniref:Neurogenic protein big brain n=1 Tax=Aceria tosichella TaxID=561515 RepID=A0A6G1SP95_9ACAR
MGLLKRQMQSTGLCRIDNCNNSERSSRRFIKTTEAPYQTIGRRTLSATLGYKELSSGYFWLSVLSESISCYLYVFIVCATRISWTGSIIGHEPNLIAMSLTSGAAMTLLMLIFRTVHVNPALTIAFLLTGRIPLIRAIIYVLVHCISSVAAIALLYSISIAGHAGALGLDNPHPLLESWQIVIIEFVISFVVTMVTYATCSYSSYTNARQYILEQVGQNCNDIFDLKSTTCDTENMASLNEGANNNQHLNNHGGLLINSATIQHHNHHHQQQRPAAATLASSLANAPRRPISTTNFRVHPQSKGYASDTYENSDFEYEYDNHRIYTHQQSSPELSPGTSRMPPIEELMHDESQLLAPNGFSFLMTPCQSFIIGVAYAMTSLTGIPASGASLNPARSFGPAFFMNRWDNHWIYWVGPILGAITAGFLFELIFNPTRASSVCYLPKLFRLSAHDMAKVSSKSRVYQNAQKPSIPSPDATNIFPSTINNRTTNAHHFPTIHHSPTSRQQTVTNLMSNTTLLNPSMRDSKHQQLIAPSTSLAHIQPSHFTGNNFDQLNYIHSQQQRQQLNSQMAHDAANFEHRSKSTAMMNLIAAKHQQNTINMPSRNNFHSASSSNGSASQDFGKFSTPGFRGFQDSSAPFGSSKPAFSEL